KRFPSCSAFYKALYKARPSGRVAEQAAKELALAGGGKNGHKVESLRDFQLDELEEHPSQAIDFGAPALPPRNPEEESNIQSEMGVTIAQPDTGALRPTLIIGVGAFGRKALLELRCRFLD